VLGGNAAGLRDGWMCCYLVPLLDCEMDGRVRWYRWTARWMDVLLGGTAARLRDEWMCH
jgi:hypothetical protein